MIVGTPFDVSFYTHKDKLSTSLKSDQFRNSSQGISEKR